MYASQSRLPSHRRPSTAVRLYCCCCCCLAAASEGRAGWARRDQLSVAPGQVLAEALNGARLAHRPGLLSFQVDGGRTLTLAEGELLVLIGLSGHLHALLRLLQSCEDLCGLSSLILSE